MLEGEQYASLRSTVATRTRKLVVWCGAGLSAPAGIPTWPVLQRRLETLLQDKLATMEIPQIQRDAKLKAIRQEKNPWVAFHRLQTELGPASFREGVKAALSRAANAETPAAYLSLWRLRPAGVINLNLDKLATRAFVESGLSGLGEFKGKEIGAHAHLLNSPRPYLCNLHGVEDDSDSWIFTQPALRELAETAAYQRFVNAVLMSSTVLFLGITADDVAVGGHLERLKADGITTAPHYWITDRRDLATDQWAEANNIIPLRYSASSADHPELAAILGDLASYVQPELPQSPPVSLELDLNAPEPEPVEALVARTPEQIRTVLNARASYLLREGNPEREREYAEFLRKYARAIHVAWYTSTDIGENDFLGLRLEQEVAKGAFGTVFRATNESGDEFAVKVLHAEIRKSPDLLNAFRRGVRSMRILGEKEVPGMARYRAASEIPATLVMDWINGANVNEIVESGTLIEWSKILDIALQLTTIVARAHELPERVLHRDIRPSNVMVNGYWEGEDLEVIVLDFDLSWHRGSVEKSVVFGSALVGYLAPEQVQRRIGVSTQHASVDSYGIGMTLFYLVSGRNPQPGEHSFSNWAGHLAQAAARPRGNDWKSLPRRVARLIDAATQEKQERRWDLIQIRSELTRLREAQNSPDAVQSAELLAEELAARCPATDTYIWDDSKTAAIKDFHTGLVTTIHGDESVREVSVILVRVAGESDNRNRLGESITRARDNVMRALQDGGWSASDDVGQGVLSITATMSVDDLTGRVGAVSDSLRRAIESLRFS